MKTATTYQDLVCWQLADELEQLVFELTAAGPASKDFKFRDQIRDSSSSATRNDRMQRLCGRSGKATTGLIRYLESLPPREFPRKRGT